MTPSVEISTVTGSGAINGTTTVSREFVSQSGAIRWAAPTRRFERPTSEWLVIHDWDLGRLAGTSR